MRARALLLSLALAGACAFESDAPELSTTQADLKHKKPRAKPACDEAPCTHDLAYYREHPEAWLTPTLTLHNVEYDFGTLSCTAELCGLVDDAAWGLVVELAVSALNLQQLSHVETSVDALLLDASNIVIGCATEGEPCEAERVSSLTQAVRAFNEGRTSVLGELCGSAVGECRLGSIQCGEGGLVCTGKLPLAEEICGNGLDDDCNGRDDDDCGCVHTVGYWRNHLALLDGKDIRFDGLTFYASQFACTAATCGIADDRGWELIHEYMAAFVNSPRERTSIDPWIEQAAHHIKTCVYDEGPCDLTGVAATIEQLRAFNEEVISVEGEECTKPQACGEGSFQCMGPVLGCAAPVPMAEIPDNGVDDDCDGTLDEGLGKTIYLNGKGGRYVHGELDSSVDNVSYLVSGQTEIPPFAGDAQDWSEVMRCVAQRFAAFGVTITDVDPSPMPHVEAVVGGKPQLLGWFNGVTGLAARNCAPTGDAVVFIFSDASGRNFTDVCNTVAHEVGHAYGLDHELLGSDLMAYSAMMERGFQDELATCGEYTSHECMCGGFEQNTYQHLLARLGARTDTPPALARTYRHRALHAATREPESEPPRLGEPLAGGNEHYVGVCATER